MSLTGVWWQETLLCLLEHSCYLQVSESVFIFCNIQVRRMLLAGLGVAFFQQISGSEAGILHAKLKQKIGGWGV